MLWSKVFTFTDPFQYQSAFRSVDVELFPTTKGKFHAELTQVNMSKLWMQSAHEDLPRVYVGTVKSQRAAIGFLTQPDQPAMQHCGMEVLPGDIVFNDAHLMHRQTAAECDWGAMSLTADDLCAASNAIAGSELSIPSRTYRVRPSPAIMSRLLEHFKLVGQIAKTAPDLLELPEVARSFEQEMIHLMIMCLTEGVALRMAVGVQRHSVIVTRLEEYLEANPYTPLYLAELCAAVGASERTLRSACEEHLGMGPVRFLNLRRMHLVRRALSQADPSNVTVTRLATDHGFWELGRFAVTYRAMFGESPHQTLHGKTADTPVFLNRPSSFGVLNS